MSNIEYVRKSKPFQILCDIVSSNSLVCLTGAGISFSLELKNNGKKMPNWIELLERIKEKLEDILSEEEKKELGILIHKKASGNELIEAASVLRHGREKEFDSWFKEFVLLKDGAHSDTHKALLDVSPRGILTFNYDDAHENTIRKFGDIKEWDKILPEEESLLSESLRDQIRRPFLLKGHGCISDIKSIVLTNESYRDLFVRYPTYRAFVQNILTNFNLLIVGFRLSDPDFDLFTQEIATRYGSPIREHVAFMHEKEISRSQEIILKRRYGIHLLRIKDFAHIPVIIKAALETASPTLDKIIRDCVADNNEVRRQAHRKISSLSKNGKICLSEVLRKEIDKLMKNTKMKDISRLSELIYTLGIIDSDNKTNKEFLIRIIENNEFVEPVAHALTVINSYLDTDDISKINKWIERFKGPPLKTNKENPDPDNRLITYAQYAKVLVRAKYKFFN
ncbi:hypothetical protein GTO91_17035 [Heliobacterium undosum]|uniref:SIR2-like domain-containing protein n=1 Tax=Heliomicrobium undosum TaxID=121734 RepID=A0A845L433_9FIRM|nr:SIR2 family protein [Heliomicrobium undosum]MZP31402.1 hypothetical protein [Heliomicrobium undosum]